MECGKPINNFDVFSDPFNSHLQSVQLHSNYLSSYSGVALLALKPHCIYYWYCNCPWYSVPKGEGIKQIVIKKFNCLGVLRKACGVVIGVANRI